MIGRTKSAGGEVETGIMSVLGVSMYGWLPYFASGNQPGISYAGEDPQLGMSWWRFPDRHNSASKQTPHARLITEERR